MYCVQEILKKIVDTVIKRKEIDKYSYIASLKI